MGMSWVWSVYGSITFCAFTKLIARITYRYKLWKKKMVSLQWRRSCVRRSNEFTIKSRRMIYKQNIRLGGSPVLVPHVLVCICTREMYPFQRNLHSLDFIIEKLCVINPTSHYSNTSRKEAEKAQLSNKQCAHSKALSQNLTSVARGGNNITITHTIHDIQRNFYLFTRPGLIFNRNFD